MSGWTKEKPPVKKIKLLNEEEEILCAALEIFIDECRDVMMSLNTRPEAVKEYKEKITIAKKLWEKLCE